MKGEAKRKPQSHGGEKTMPQKRFYRARAHSNPFSDSQFPVPIDPDRVEWSQYFPSFFPKRPESGAVTATAQGTEAEPTLDVPSGTHQMEAQAQPTSREAPEAGREGGEAEGAPLVRFADIGCGFGGLLVKLSTMFPDTLMVGMELRDKVSEYVRERIEALREKNAGQYGNIAVIRTNAMKYLPNYFRKGQLTKMFFLFPDPHFKEKNHRRRIITAALLAEYAYVVATGGILYTVTDVQELGEWMDAHLAAHPLFQKISQQELDSDPVVPLLTTSSEEALKVERNSGQTFIAVYRRVPYGQKGA